MAMPPRNVFDSAINWTVMHDALVGMWDQITGFNYRYYPGQYASDPTVAPDGQPIRVGDMYFSSVTNGLKIYIIGGTWADYSQAAAAASAAAAAADSDAAASAANSANISASDAAEDRLKAEDAAAAAAASESSAAGSADSAAAAVDLRVSPLELLMQAFSDVLKIGGSRVYPFFVEDNDGRYSIWIDKAGHFGIADLEDVRGVIGKLVDRFTDVNLRSGYVATLGEDNDGRVPMGIGPNGHLKYWGADVHDFIGQAGRASIQAVARPQRDIVIVGDSTAEGAGTGTTGQTFGVQLQARYAAVGDTRTVTSFGRGGQRGAAILARQSGIAPAFIALPTGSSGFAEIPSSGSANVTMSVDLLTRAGDSTDQSITGEVFGVNGTLTRNGSTGQYTFTRASAGAVVRVDATAPFITSIATTYRNYTYVCWICTNDINSVSSPLTAAQMLAQIDTYVSWQITSNKMFAIVMPLLDGLGASLSSAKILYSDLLSLVKSKYPRHYVDSLAELQRANDGSAGDLADVAAGITPRSLNASTLDRLHLNVAGYGIIVTAAKRVLDNQGA